MKRKASGPYKERAVAPAGDFKATDLITMGEMAAFLRDLELARAPRQDARQVYNRMYKKLQYHAQRNELQVTGKRYRFGDLLAFSDQAQRNTLALIKNQSKVMRASNTRLRGSRPSATASGLIVHKGYTLPETVEECHALIKEILKDR